MTKCCIVPNCNATSRDFGTFLFSFPKAEDLRRQWIKALGKPDDWSVPEMAYVCWAHFENKAILQEENTFRRSTDAVPVQFLEKNMHETGDSEQFCRFCAKKIFRELLSNNLNDMNCSEDSRKLLCFLLPESDALNLSHMACDDCFIFLKLATKFIRNCKKATEQLAKISNSEKNYQHKLECEFGIPSVNTESDISMEGSSAEEFYEQNMTDTDVDGVPLVNQIEQNSERNDLNNCTEQNEISSHTKKHRNIRKSVERKPFACPNCLFSCSKPNQLASHRKKHKLCNLDAAESVSSNDITFKGQYVQPRLETIIEQTQDVKPLTEDFNSTHVTNISNRLQCPNCPYTCERIIQLASHRKKHSSKRTKDDNKLDMVKDFYECEFCDFRCKLQRQMAGHRASHSSQIKKSKPSGKERDHMCSICGKILSTRGSFFLHMKYHNDQRDYSCTVCDRKFYSKRDVAMHVESFHEKKVFECEICGVKCTWKNALYKHMRKHDSSSFKHECSYCGKKFMAANELRLHVWRHTGQQLTCDLCGAGYRFNFLLTQHKIREHGIQVEGVKLYKRFRKNKKQIESRERTEVKQSSNGCHSGDAHSCVIDSNISNYQHHLPESSFQSPVEQNSANSSFRTS
ncbi:zinc finger protein 33A-like [Malaya genurostris]|uniref:zinc finger protein 33A-like n=1 Tax=Malaya genurostris TaxID=325434 RepID=UPI0026F39D2C|nr:zinc finger protein 33A-like [Malaya genurostris]